ncbi:MAG: tRNA lysidine(34) synthetase TilS [Candidatus Margulisbacteria bacterium]|nr:tRNA lysidine(34) synthetase TilS [Candidatus Margulisiibacteriota bacterium]MBU1022439.1 tRNA lysidine(34) synthetase TilS [Candidatus Margulisiibacteriota bacterium]MBU1728423.1 tRNA lysidine(34) synthetase TilS [Candidatus Margulisiibacteriota bacterium]MBU1954570.1 tRNA lysidine(34) synthetase TilS [Candidatus Margulisiibacteriota bacterium]
MIDEKFLETVREYEMLNPQDKVLVGVSGGADSIALLQLLADYRRQLNISVHVAHLNHLMRGADADGDEKYVQQLAKSFSFPITIERFAVREYAEKNKMGIEEAARKIRYEFYEKLARDTGAQKIALGHNADDNIETFIMRLLRGAGTSGLVGIPPVRNKFVRPLILTWRRDIEKYCASKKLVPRIDHTNYESIYLRNRVRLKLIPQLKVFNNNIKDLLLNTILLLTNDNLYLLSKAEKAFRAVCKKSNSDEVVLKVKKFMELEAPIKGHVLRQAILAIKGDLKEIAYIHIQDILKLVGETEKKEIHLPGLIRVEIDRDSISFIRGEQAKVPGILGEYGLHIPGQVVLESAGVRIVAKPINIINNIDINASTDKKVYINYDRVGRVLQVRGRRTGDKFHPLGITGTKKIQDFFVDEKISRADRDKVPIVLSEGKIVWVAGFRLDDEFKVTPKTRRVLELRMEELKA